MNKIIEWFNGGKCWNDGEYHYHKGMIVTAPPPYPNICMECGEKLPDRNLTQETPHATQY